MCARKIKARCGQEVKSMFKRYQKWKSRNKSRLRDYGYMLHLFLKNPLAMMGLIIMLILVVTGILADFIAPYDPLAINVKNKLQSPSWEHLFGTDQLGRDNFSRVVYGARISVYLIAVVITLRYTIAILVGVIAGFYRGIIDEVLMRITDIFLAFPSILLAMIIAVAMKPGLTTAIIALAVTGWPWAARLVRSQTLYLREQDYIEAARALGAGNLRIIIFHIVPNCIGPILVQASVSIGWVVLTAASLGFIGAGITPPTPEWGLTVAEGQTVFPLAPWVSLFPGFAIFLTVVGANLLGDGLRDVMDPRLRRR